MNYKKPQITILQIEGNDRLCGDCADKGYTTISNAAGWIKDALGFSIGNFDGTVTRAEVENAFSSGEPGCNEIVDMYCKFTSSGEMVAWS